MSKIARSKTHRNTNEDNAAPESGVHKVAEPTREPGAPAITLEEAENIALRGFKPKLVGLVTLGSEDEASVGDLIHSALAPYAIGERLARAALRTLGNELYVLASGLQGEALQEADPSIIVSSLLAMSARAEAAALLDERFERAEASR